MRRTVCNVIEAAVILASYADILRGSSCVPALRMLGRIAWQSKRTSVWEGGYCCTDGGVLSKRMPCRLRLHLRAQAIDLGHMSMQVAVSDRRQQFDAWNVGFRNHIGPFDLGFHSRCNNDQKGAKVKTPKNPLGFKQNQKKIPGPKFNPQNPLICLTLSLLPKKIFAKIFLPQKMLKSKISRPKNSFDHPFHLNPAPPPHPTPMHGNNSSHAQGPTPSRTWQVRGSFCKSKVLVRLASWKLITANSLLTDTSIKGTPH